MDNIFEKDIKFAFDEECMKTFECKRKKLISAPVITAPSWCEPFDVMCDASGISLGVVTGQKREKIFQPIYYASKELNSNCVPKDKSCDTPLLKILKLAILTKIFKCPYKK